MGNIQRILDSGKNVDDRLDRVAANANMMTLAQYRYWMHLQNQVAIEDRISWEDYRRTEDQARKATRKELAPFVGKAWKTRQPA